MGFYAQLYPVGRINLVHKFILCTSSSSTQDNPFVLVNLITESSVHKCMPCSYVWQVEFTLYINPAILCTSSNTQDYPTYKGLSSTTGSPFEHLKQSKVSTQ